MVVLWGSSVAGCYGWSVSCVFKQQLFVRGFGEKCLELQAYSPAWLREARRMDHGLVQVMPMCCLALQLWLLLYRKVECTFAKDHKTSQLKRGSHHNCRIDETIQLEVTGAKESGEA